METMDIGLAPNASKTKPLHYLLFNQTTTEANTRTLLFDSSRSASAPARLDHNREKRAETNNKRTSYTEHFQVPETLQTPLDATEKLRITVECTIAVDHSHSSRSGPFIDRAGYGRLAAALPPQSIAIFVFLFPVFPRRAFTFAHTPRSVDRLFFFRL